MGSDEIIYRGRATAEQMRSYAQELNVKLDVLPPKGRVEVTRGPGGALEIDITGKPDKDGMQRKFQAGVLGTKGEPDPERNEMLSAYTCVARKKCGGRKDTLLLGDKVTVNGAYPDGKKIIALAKALEALSKK